MDEVFIKSPSGLESLRFFDRDPEDRSKPIDSFMVCVTGLDLSATTRVWAGYTHSQPIDLFTDMASQWAGWESELIWASLEGELSLRCTHDKRGHIAIHAKLRSGLMPDNWRVEATVVTEAGQLERVALQALGFFGN